MFKGILLAMILGLGLQAHAYTEVAVHTITCAQAIKNVEKEKRYYLQTAFDGIIPIYVTIPVSKNPTCGNKQRVSYEVIRTSDVPECLVGYNCVPS